MLSIMVSRLGFPACFFATKIWFLVIMFCRKVKNVLQQKKIFGDNISVREITGEVIAGNKYCGSSGK